MSIALLAALFSCDPGSTSPDTEALSPGAQGIIIQPSELSIDEGAEARLHVFERLPTGELGRELSRAEWESSDTDVARIESGVVSGAGEGSGRITARVGEHKATADVRVLRRPASITLLSGGGQNARVATDLQQPIAVRVLSNLGRPVRHASVGFAVVTGGGATASSDVVTDHDGVARTLWTLGPIAGGQQLLVRVAGSGPLELKVTAIARPGPVHFFAVQPANLSLEIGSSIQLEISARDEFGNDVDDVPVTWTVESPAVAAVSGNGVVEALQAGATKITATLSPAYLQSLLGSGTSITSRSSTSAVRVSSSAGYSVSFEGDAQTGLVGAPLSHPLSLKVMSGNGTPASQVAVDWVLLSGQGALSSARTTSDADGVAQVGWTLGTASGAQSVEARVQLPNLPVTTFTATALPGPTAVIEVQPSHAVLRPGESLQFSARATDRYGNAKPAAFRWSVADPLAASVTGAGLVTGVRGALTKVVATAEAISDEANLEVVGAPSGGDTTPPTVSLASPASGSTAAGTVNVTAAASDVGGVGSVFFHIDGVLVGSDETAPYEYAWNSASVANGSHTLTASARDVAGNSATSDPVVVNVSNSDSGGGDQGGGQPPPPQPPPPTGWHRLIADTLVQGNLVIASGEKWLIGGNVRVAGNVLVQNATLGMRAGSSLEFVGASPEAYVGGGLHYSTAVDGDRGLWVWGSGQLDIACTPKTSWNRSGVDPSWSSGDEYWIAPTEVHDFAPRRWYPGQSIPRVDPRVPAAEVVNVTRDCVVTGPGHIHINSSSPQRIEYVRLQGLGISNRAHRGPVLGRYALHLHMSGDGTRGTIIRGVAAVQSRGTVFVPHSSHGVTMIDNVSVSSYGDGLWWDMAHVTNDLLVDRLAVVGVQMPESASGVTSAHDGFVLGAGSNTEVRNSVAAGVTGSRGAIGFDWPEPTPPFNSVLDRLVWRFDLGNVAHNNRGAGIRFWNNVASPHVIANYASYRNAGGVFENGAYQNGNAYRNVVAIDDGYLFDNDRNACCSAAWWNSNGSPNSAGGVPGFTNGVIAAKQGPALTIGHRQLPATEYVRFVDVTLVAGPGHPKVRIMNGQNPWKAHFIRAGVVPDDFDFDGLSGGNEGTHILIDHEDGRKWEIRVENGQKLVTTR